MKTLSPNHGLKAIRSATGLSHRKFGEAVGISFAAIQMMEVGKRRLTEELASRIHELTGCDPAALLRGEALSIGGEKYSGEVYEKWTSSQPSEEDINAAADYTGDCCRLLVMAAARDGSGNPHPRRYREVTAALNQAIDAVVKRFGLQDSLNVKLAGTGRTGEWVRMTLADLRKEFRSLPTWKEIDSTAQPDNVEVEVRSTTFPVWKPLFTAWPGGPRAEPDVLVQAANVKIEFKLPWRHDTPSLTRFQWTIGNHGDDQALVVYGTTDDDQHSTARWGRPPY